MTTHVRDNLECVGADDYVLHVNDIHVITEPTYEDVAYRLGIKVGVM